MLIHVQVQFADGEGNTLIFSHYRDYMAVTAHIRVMMLLSSMVTIASATSRSLCWELIPHAGFATLFTTQLPVSGLLVFSRDCDNMEKDNLCFSTLAYTGILLLAFHHL